METVKVDLPSALVKAANLEGDNLSQDAARLLALELYREGKVSLGRAAELSRHRWQHSWISLRSMAFPLRYSFEDLELPCGL